MEWASYSHTQSMIGMVATNAFGSTDATTKREGYA
jgi:hypothetical protein